AVLTPTRTRRVPSVVCGASATSAVAPRASPAGAGSPYSNAFTHSSTRIDDGSGSAPAASWARPTWKEPVSTASANVDSASSVVATNVESPLSTNTLSSVGAGQEGSGATTSAVLASIRAPPVGALDDCSTPPSVSPSR